MTDHDVPLTASATAPRVLLYSRMWRSGTGLYVQGLAGGLADAGCDVSFIAPLGEPEDVGASRPTVRRRSPPREYVEGSIASRPQRALRSLRRIAEGIGALLVQGARIRNIIVTIPEPLAFSLLPMALLRLIGCRIVFVCHDPRPHAWRLKGPLRKVEHAAHGLSYRLATTVVVLAKSAKTVLTSEFGISQDKIVVIPHGAFETPDAGRVAGTFNLLLFGTIRRNKQVTLAIGGVALARQRGCAVTLTVAGGPDANDPAYLDECRAAASVAGDAVSLEIGYASIDRQHVLFGQADALLLPYGEFDSQSGVAVLAGLAGRPVIAAAAGGIADLIGQGLAAEVIAQPIGEAEIADAIERFYAQSPARWADRATRGQTMLATALDWRTIGGQFARLF